MSVSGAILEGQSSFAVNNSLECNGNSSQFGSLDEKESEDCDFQVRELSPVMAATQLDTQVETLSLSSSERR